MDIYYIYIIGGIAILFITYLIVLVIYMQSRKSMMIEEFMKKNCIVALSEKQKRLLVFGVIPFLGRKENLLSLIPNRNLNKYKNSLKIEWGISNTEQVKECLKYLLTLEKTSDIDVILHLNGSKVQKIKKDISASEQIEFSDIDAIESTYAWDVARIVALAKWSFRCGYISETEMWNYIEKAEKIAMEKGKDWKEYTLSYLLGRSLHGYDISMIMTEVEQLLDGGINIKEGNIYRNYYFKN